MTKELSDIPYDPDLALPKAIAWLNEHKENIANLYSYPFDSPDYWGMPKHIAKQLYPDSVDYIQYWTHYGWND